MMKYLQGNAQAAAVTLGTYGQELSFPGKEVLERSNPVRRLEVLPLNRRPEWEWSALGLS